MNTADRIVLAKLARAAAPLEVSAKDGRGTRILTHEVDWRTVRRLRRAGLVTVYRHRGVRVAELSDAGWAAVDDGGTA